jgi:hypothetical protein
MEIIQPRVARNELPWVGGPLSLNPERVPSKPQTDTSEEKAGERRPFNATAAKFNGCECYIVFEFVLRVSALGFLSPLDLRISDFPSVVEKNGPRKKEGRQPRQ